MPGYTLEQLNRARKGIFNGKNHEDTQNNKDILEESENETSETERFLPYLIDDDALSIYEEDEIVYTRHDYSRLLDGCLLDQSENYPPPVPVIWLIQNENNCRLLTLKSFSLLQGKQKSKKTTFLSMMIAAYISPNVSNQAIRFQCEGEQGKVLYIDTEQGQSQGSVTMKRILKMAKLEDSENLIYYDFRELAPELRKKLLLGAINRHEGIKIVVIDGLVDLMTDFQDAREAHALISSILKICSKYDVHVIGVLHQNKNNENARSFVGLISSQKCEMEIALENLGDITTVECRNSRGKPFEKFAFRWDNGKFPRIDQDYKPGSKKEKSKKEKFDINSLSSSEHDLIVKAIFKNNSEFNNGELKDQIKLKLKKYANIVEPLARDFVSHWQSLNLIEMYKGARNANIFRLYESE